MLVYAEGVKLAIVGWHEGMAGQLHAFLEQEGCIVDCFVNDYVEKPCIDPRPARKARQYSYPESDSFKGLPLITSEDWPGELAARGIEQVIIASSDNTLRQQCLRTAAERVRVLSYVHPSATILPDAVLEPGSIMLARSLLGYRAELHTGGVLNTACHVDHHAVVGQAAAVMPGAVVCGNVWVGPRALIGAGAVLKQKVRIGEDCTVGAGAVVIRDTEPASTVIGVPARCV